MQERERKAKYKSFELEEDVNKKKKVEDERKEDRKDKRQNGD